MSSLSWDFPSSSTNPTDDDEDTGEVNGLGRPEHVADDGDENPMVDLDEDASFEAGEIEARERDELESLERQLLAQLEQEHGAALHQEMEQDREQLESLEQLEAADLESLEQIEAADLESAEQAEREMLEQLELEQLRQLGLLEGQTDAPAAPPAPRPSKPPRPPKLARPATGATPTAPAWETSAADAEARAAQFLAASERRTSDEAGGGSRSLAPATERRELNEPARAARAIVEHRHRNLIEANALLTEARRVLAPIAFRGLSDRTYLRRKIILGIGEAVSLAVAFSAAFDVAPLEGLLLSGAIALAFVIAGDLGGVLRVVADRSRLSAALEDDVVHLDPRYHHILYHSRQPWLSMIGGGTAAIFALATVSVGILRAANRGSVGLAAGLGLLTVSLAIAAGLSAWQHTSIGSEIIDHLQREEAAAARRLKRAAASRVLRRPMIMGVVGGDDLDLPSRAADVDWSAPAGEWPPAGATTWPPRDLDWEQPTAELQMKRPRRGGRGGREKPAKREKGSGGSLVGAAAARGAVFLATLPGKLRRSEDAGPAAPRKESRKESKRESKIEDMSVSGDGPGALGESAGPVSAVAFRPPIQSPKKFG